MSKRQYEHQLETNEHTPLSKPLHSHPHPTQIKYETLSSRITKTNATKKEESPFPTRYSPLSPYSGIIDDPGVSIDIERGRDFSPDFEKEANKYSAKASMRYLYGYDYNVKNFLGTDKNIEKNRADSLNRVIEYEQYYESVCHLSLDKFGHHYTKALKFNNECYKTVYQSFFIFLSLTFGVLTSIFLAVLTATFEFTIQFFFRPLLKMARMIAEIFVCYCCVQSIFVEK